MDLIVTPLDPSRRSDFYRIHHPQNGEGWCNCVAWWVPTWDGWDERTAEQNRALREELFDSGEYDGYLLYADGRPVGWCQCGPRDRLSKLCAQFGLSPDPDVWAVTCFVVVPGARGQGFAHVLLGGVLDDLRDRGVARVHAYPRPGRTDESGEAWMGPEGVYARAGFRPAADGRTWEIDLRAGAGSHDGESLSQ